MKPYQTLLLSGSGSLVPESHPGRLDRDRRIFYLVENGKPWRYKGRTAFKLMEMYRQGADIASWINLYTKLGFNTFRVFRNKPASSGSGFSDPGWSTPSLLLADEFMNFMSSMGCRVELTLVTQIESSLDDLPSWAEMLQSHDNTFMEGVNEPDGRKNPAGDVWNKILSALMPKASGEYDPSKPLPGNYLTWHADRNSDPREFSRKAKGILEMYDGWDGYNSPKIPVVGDEPAKPSEYGYDIPGTLAHFGIYGLFGAGGTFHDLDGQFIYPPKDNDYECAKAAAQGLNAFPEDAPNVYSYRHDDVAKQDEIKTGSSRTYLTYGSNYGVRCCPTDGSPTLIGV